MQNITDITVYVDGCVFDRYDVLYAEGEISAACAFTRYFGWVAFTYYHEGE